jgi:hypothetical protein
LRFVYPVRYLLSWHRSESAVGQSRCGPLQSAPVSRPPLPRPNPAAWSEPHCLMTYGNMAPGRRCTHRGTCASGQPSIAGDAPSVTGPESVSRVGRPSHRMSATPSSIFTRRTLRGGVPRLVSHRTAGGDGHGYTRPTCRHLGRTTPLPALSARPSSGGRSALARAAADARQPSPPGHRRLLAGRVEGRFHSDGRDGIRLGVLENTPTSLAFCWSALGRQEIDRRADNQRGRPCVVMTSSSPDCSEQSD